MGQSKGNGYTQMETLTPDIKSFIQQLSQLAIPNQQAAAEGYKQFLPGGTGGEAIANQAQQRFQQQTIPSILNSFGQGSKSSSALNQALAAGGANLNTDIASMLAQMQLQASQGIGNLGTTQGNTAAATPQFAYLQKQPPFWQQAALALTNAAGETAKGYASR
jgi:hypothetical protein